MKVYAFDFDGTLTKKDTFIEFIEYSKDAQHTMPKSVGDDQERFKGYQAGVQEVIDVVNQANEKAKAGNLVEAKEMIEQLDEMRKKYHKEYK